MIKSLDWYHTPKLHQHTLTREIWELHRKRSRDKCTLILKKGIEADWFAAEKLLKIFLVVKWRQDFQVLYEIYTTWYQSTWRGKMKNFNFYNYFFTTSHNRPCFVHTLVPHSLQLWCIHILLSVSLPVSPHLSLPHSLTLSCSFLYIFLVDQV